MSQDIRRNLAAVVAVGIAFALPACGSTTPRTTNPNADAYARAVNLKASDLPGAKIFQQGFSGENPAEIRSQERELAGLRCGGRIKVINDPFSGTASLPLGYHNWVVISLVLVMPNQSAAKAELAALGSPRGRACLVRKLGEGRIGGESNVTSSVVRVTTIPAAAALGAGAIGLRIVATQPSVELPSRLRRIVREKLKKQLPKRTAAATLYVDGVIFRVGSAEVWLLARGEQPIPSAIEQHLQSLLQSRADAATV
jgi:hypothetical protein